MGIPDHLTCLLRDLYVGQEATVRTGHGTADWFQIGKGVRQGCILSPCLFNLHADYIMWTAGLDETQAGIKIAERNINNLRYADIVVVQWPCHVQLFANPQTVAHQVCLSLTTSQSLPTFMFIASVMPSSHLILWHPLLLLPSVFPSLRDFSNQSAVHIRWPKHWSFSFSISPSNMCSGLISLKIDWFDLPDQICGWYHSKGRKWGGTKGPLDEGERGE